MRRITLALALIGAVAATGCGQTSTSNAGGARGVGPSTFTITIQNGQNQVRSASGVLPLEMLNGSVTSSPNGISCAAGSLNGCAVSFASYQADGTPNSVTLTAAGTGGNVLLGWAGDCATVIQSDGTVAPTCTLKGPGDKYVLARFGPAGAYTAHPNWSDPTLHAAQYLAFSKGQPGAWDCTRCHGANLMGQGIAPSCATCHNWPAIGAHFDAAAGAYGNHGWTQACLRCHTDQGFRDYIGEFASTCAGNVETTPSDDHLATTGTPAILTGLTTCTVTSTQPRDPVTGANPADGSYAYGIQKCVTCHNPVSDPIGTSTLQGLMFPSGVQVNPDKITTLCGQCHEARESTVSVNTAIGSTAADTVMGTGTGVSFKNPHYRGAAATLYGKIAQGWAQYAGASYTGQNAHGGEAKCTFCHNAHTGELPDDSATVPAPGTVGDKCGACHYNTVTGLPVMTMAELEANRQFGFEGDLDGDGTVESLYQELEGQKANLLAAIQAYAFNVVGQGICFDATGASYPYFFKHSTATGDCTAAEMVSANAFKQFTPRLYRATYNLKFANTEFGAWAHNPRYAAEVIYDSIADLNQGLGVAGKALSPNGNRSFDGHFGAADAGYAAFIYGGATNTYSSELLPPMGFTSDACIQCHGGQNGLETYLAGAPAAMPAGSKDLVANKVTGMQCATCHDISAGTDMKSLRTVTTNYFPPQKAGAAGSFAIASNTLPASFAVCASCHSGRENMASVTALGYAKGTFTGTKTVNPHYLGAGAMVLGSTVTPMYQYGTNTYATTAPFFNGTAASGPHGSPHAARCMACHDPKATSHGFGVDLDTTVPQGIYTNHQGVSAPNTLTCNGCHTGQYALSTPKARLDALAAGLITAMQSYAAANGVPQPCYNAAGYHGNYFFQLAADGVTCANTAANAYATFDLSLAAAAFNYTWYGKEPGAFAHNYDYMAEVLYDGILDLGGTIPTDPVTGTGPITRP